MLAVVPMSAWPASPFLVPAQVVAVALVAQTAGQDNPLVNTLNLEPSFGQVAASLVLGVLPHRRAFPSRPPDDVTPCSRERRSCRRALAGAAPPTSTAPPSRSWAAQHSPGTTRRGADYRFRVVLACS